ncbi:tryparedoxin-like [Diadema antillarum]|uniref:tryparedoxin-like n=1 Tax=Diadema antillarum TaxID=105358 RepID=UPI003A84B273
MSDSMVALLGSTLQGQDGSSVDTQTLVGEGRYVGLYFSAHWCPPCRAFTPNLAEFYKKFKAKPEKKDQFEIVFISSDQTEDQCKMYFADMPWLMVPFADRAKKAELGTKFGVSGIPTLVILNSTDGKVVNKQGRQAVMADPEGEDFPWGN